MSATIVGRAREQLELRDAFASKSAEFMAIYGRRRVGKTFLVVNYFQSLNAVYFQTTGIKNSPTDTQLARFATELGHTFYQGAPIERPADWMRALEQLTRAMELQPAGGKIVLFFDELPWLATHKSGLLAALEYFWNRHWSHDVRVKLIVCGSSASWIIKKIIKNRGGLHNRVTRRIHLQPFSLQETAAFLKHMGNPLNRERTLKTYMTIGGIAFYLKQLKKGRSLDQNTANLLFNPEGALFDEFTEIFASLFDHAESHEELVRIAASRREGVSRREIETRNKLTGKGGMLSRRLKDLEAAGFIASHVPFGKKKRGAVYRVSDEYCAFYLTWIDPIKDKLKSDTGANYWLSNLKTPKYHGWLGYAFENVCYKHLSPIRRKLGMEGFAPASMWRHSPPKRSGGDGAQIDLLFDRDDDAITLCEIKYTDKPFLIDKACARSLLEKESIFAKITGTKKQLFLAMVSAHGVADNLYAQDLLDGVVELDDLFTGGE
jgi:hypothetical protein